MKNKIKMAWSWVKKHKRELIDIASLSVGVIISGCMSYSLGKKAGFEMATEKHMVKNEELVKDVGQYLRDHVTEIANTSAHEAVNYYILKDCQTASGLVDAEKDTEGIVERVMKAKVVKQFLQCI